VKAGILPGLMLVLVACEAAGPAGPTPFAGDVLGSSGRPSASDSVDPSSVSPTAGAAFSPPLTPVSLRLWHPWSGPNAEAFSRIVAAFNAETPTVKISVEAHPPAEMQQQLAGATAPSQLPDVVVLDDTRVAENAIAETVQPIDDFAAQVGLSPDEYTSDVWNAGIWNGKRYGLPIDVHPEAVFWNKSVFRSARLDPDNPPADQHGFVDAIKEIRLRTGIAGYMVVGSGSEGRALQGPVFASLFIQAGGKWTTPDFSAATYNDGAGVEAADFLEDLVEDVKLSVVEAGADRAAFRAGKNGLVFGGTSETREFREALGNDLGVSVFPQIFGPGVWAGSHQVAVTAGVDGTRKAGAYTFMDWLSRHALDLADAGEIPAASSIREQLAGSGDDLDPLIAKVAPEVADARLLPSIPGGADLLFLDTGAADAVLQVVSGKQDTTSALDASVAHLTTILRANRDKYGY
jgi:multiple sugar transport system substrate-binding protein